MNNEDAFKSFLMSNDYKEIENNSKFSFNLTSGYKSTDENLNVELTNNDIIIHEIDNDSSFI